MSKKYHIFFSNNIDNLVLGMLVGDPHSSVSYTLTGEHLLSDYPSDLEPIRTYTKENSIN